MIRYNFMQTFVHVSCKLNFVYNLLKIAKIFNCVNNVFDGSV